MSTAISNRGFTLIEIIVVIVLTAIIGTVIARIVSRPIEGFIDLATRAELVDIAELTIKRMSREIQLALPNSVRLSGGAGSCSASPGTPCSVEILRTSAGGRYRAKSSGGPGPSACGGSVPQDRLSFTSGADCFEVLGTLLNVPVAGGTNQNSCLIAPRSSDCLIIFNTGQTGANAYNGDNIAGITAASANTITFDITGNGVTRFPFPSSRQRFYIVDMPVSFVCDVDSNEITRQADYTITAAQATNPGGTVSVLANNISACTFTYDPGTNSRNGLLIVDLTISAVDTQGSTNSMRILEQIQVQNIP